ncbi:lipoxygenase [Xylariaceae sp. FL1272]|nr:lipoxygenase [Xylariaceae sp. FL1272]
MKFSLVDLLLAAAAVNAAAVPSDTYSYGSDESHKFSLPSHDRNSTGRKAALDAKRVGWQYGPSMGGTNAPYPIGDLANKTIKAQHDLWFPPITSHVQNVNKDTAAAQAFIEANGNITSLDDFANKLYADGQWPNVFPGGPLPGILTNYTDDRTFSYFRLTGNPYKLRRVQAKDELWFPVDNAKIITGLTLNQLQKQGRLFSVDYTALKDLETLPVPKLFGGFCQAYFYISPKGGDFLPLAIKLNNPGSDLIYTPEDEANDWLLAKMAFNSNDLWHLTWAHITHSHSQAEHSYQTANRALSEDHPIMGVIHRLMKYTWGIRPLLYDGVMVPGSPVEHYFPFTGPAGSDYADSLYNNGETGSWSKSYFRTTLQDRGLINSKFGPALKHFPYYEDVSVIYDTARDFIKTVVHAYYANDRAVQQDEEIQTWLSESEVAKTIDFVPSISTRDTLIDAVTHFAYLGAVVHGVLSTDGAIGLTAALPFSPTAFRKPMPTEKGVTYDDLLAYLPGVYGAVQQVSTFAGANRPEYRNTGETISHMWDDPLLLSRMVPQVAAANHTFTDKMNKFSTEIRARAFDKNGLSRGAPFMWNIMDPNWAAYNSVV